MSIALIGRGASYEFRWRRWALLRDTAGTWSPDPHERFRWFNTIGTALVSGIVRIPAAELGVEVVLLQSQLKGLPVTTLSIAPDTAAVLYMGAKLAATRPLTAHELEHVAPAGNATDLAEYFASMCDSMLRVCEHPLVDRCIQVVDG
ncbi:MAG: hypothetical protein IPQ07_33590 [Myxococcales bacterium]|nr:hypothetical protein [Myxococcales bacterium]